MATGPALAAGVVLLAGLALAAAGAVGALGGWVSPLVGVLLPGLVGLLAFRATDPGAGRRWLAGLALWALLVGLTGSAVAVAASLAAAAPPPGEPSLLDRVAVPAGLFVLQSLAFAACYGLCGRWRGRRRLAAVVALPVVHGGATAAAFLVPAALG
jgi:hypothetical protein